MSDNLWGGNANCYAYSCNDPHAPPLLNGSACPGGIARQGVFARKGESEQDFAERLIKGVLLDGGHNNLVISVSSRKWVSRDSPGSLQNRRMVISLLSKRRRC